MNILDILSFYLHLGPPQIQPFGWAKYERCVVQWSRFLRLFLANNSSNSGGLLFTSHPPNFDFTRQNLPISVSVLSLFCPPVRPSNLHPYVPSTNCVDKGALRTYTLSTAKEQKDENECCGMSNSADVVLSCAQARHRILNGVTRRERPSASQQAREAESTQKSLLYAYHRKGKVFSSTITNPYKYRPRISSLCTVNSYLYCLAIRTIPTIPN